VIKKYISLLLLFGLFFGHTDFMHAQKFPEKFHKYGFKRTHYKQEAIFVGSGEIGGYVDGLGLNSSVLDTQMTNEKGRIIKTGFQTQDLFNAEKPWKKDFVLNARTHTLKLMVQPYVNGGFDLNKISHYTQFQHITSANVVTKFRYDSTLEFTITSLCPYQERRLVAFKIEIKNHGSEIQNIKVVHRISDSTALSLQKGKLICFKTADTLIEGRLSTGFSEVYAVCNVGNNSILEPGKSFVDEAFFAVCTERTGLNPKEIVKKSTKLGFDTILKFHTRLAKKMFEQAWVNVPDTNLQKAYLQGLYMSFGNVRGRWLPMAGMWGSGGWSGTSYAWDSFHPFYSLLTHGHASRTEPALHKIIDDILRTKHAFINFAYDTICNGGSGRYSNELHDSPAGPATLWLIKQLAIQQHDDTLYKKWQMVMYLYSLEAILQLKSTKNGYQKDSIYWSEGRKYIVRSLESDRRPGWYTDVAFAYQWLLKTTSMVCKNNSRFDAEIVRRCRQISDSMYIPQDEKYYHLFKGDHFPDVPSNGWEKKKWNYHNAVAGIFPFEIANFDQKMKTSLMYPYLSKKEDRIDWGGYPLLSILAAQRLGLNQNVESLLYQKDFLYYGNKVNLETGNTIEDNNSFLMSYAAIPEMLMESMCVERDSLLYILTCILPKWQKEGISFKNTMNNGTIIGGQCKNKRFKIKIIYSKNIRKKLVIHSKQITIISKGSQLKLKGEIYNGGYLYSLNAEKDWIVIQVLLE